MPTASKKSIYDILNEIYTRKGYYARYSLDVWISVILCILFISVIFYHDFQNRIKPIKADWINQRCNPAVMPFAGIINNGPGTTKLEFTAQNFTHCTQNILKHVATVAFKPFYYMLSALTKVFDEIADSINKIRAVFNKIRNAFAKIISILMSQLVNITLPIIQLSINIKDTLQKTVGILTAAIFTLYGAFLTMKSLFLFLVDLIIIILLIIVGIIVGLMIVSMIPIFGSWAFPIIASMIVIMIAILVPVIMIKIFLDEVLAMSTRRTPGVPGCFAATSKVNVKSNDGKTYEKNISDVEVGDILSADAAVVTGIIKFSATEQQVFNLHGVFVTGEHRVLHDTLGWMQVKNHPDSVFVPDFCEPFVYCLLTSTKTFQIGTTTYSDWDDVDEKVQDALQRNCVEKGYLPVAYTVKDIHAYLDNGFHGESLVRMSNGSARAINTLLVHDKLADGGTVVGIVKIDVSDMDVFIYSLRSTTGEHVKFCATANIQVSDPLFLGESNGMQINSKRQVALDETYMYQLLTTTGQFTVNGICCKDYNAGLDKYLVDY